MYIYYIFNSKLIFFLIIQNIQIVHSFPILYQKIGTNLNYLLLFIISKDSAIIAHHFGRLLENTSRKLLSSLWTFRTVPRFASYPAKKERKEKEKRPHICHQTRIKRTFAPAVHVDTVPLRLIIEATAERS